MTFYSLFVAALLIGNVASAVIETEETPSLFEKLKAANATNNRLIFENFTKNVFTVPGYSNRETKDPADPPFEPTLECGDQFVNLTEGQFGTIRSPNYPDTYSSNLRCEWVIESIPGTVVEATFFDAVTQPWLFSFTDYVLVSTTGKWDNYRRFAGDANSKMPFTFVSKENRLAVRLVTSKWLNFRGFKMSYVVRAMKPSDDSPPENEYGSAFNNDLVAVCSSKPIVGERLNTKYQKEVTPFVQQTVSQNETHKIVRIVNGVETLPHQYPFMVGVLADESFFCGGSLIDPNHILTAAHCVDKSERVDLFFGVFNMSNRAENWYARQVRSIQFPDIANSVYIHPSYDSRSGAHDIAIVRVPTVKITKYVQPIFLPSVYSSSNSFSGWTLKTLGWGATNITEETFKLTPVLRQASATVITTVECRDDFGGAVTGNNICTRNPVQKPANVSSDAPPAGEGEGESTSDAETIQDVEYESPCHGDSGAPLFAEFAESVNGVDEDGKGLDLNKAGASNHECVNAKQNGASSSVKQPQPDSACQRPKDSNDRWYVQVGVLSFGSSVCGQDTPVSYTRVTAYLQWIAYITGRHG